MKLLKTVQNIIEEYDLFRRGDAVIVGFSGGPDSLCLLHLLIRLKEEMDLTIRAVHLEHGFRGKASENDAAFAERFCRDHGIECAVYRENVRQQARDAGISEETAGRNARYRCFFTEKKAMEDRLKLKGKAEARVRVAVAHNRNDQAETILMRIMRGTGLEGLRGMEMLRQDGLIRPLLTTDRSEIEAYCEAHHLEPCLDLTNQEPDYTRNRIRLELIPYMREYFNENVEEALCRLGQIAAENHEIVRNEVNRIGTCVDDRVALRKLPAGVRHGVIMAKLKELGLTSNLSAVHLEQIDELLRGNLASGAVGLPKGYGVSVSYDRVLWQTPASAGGSLSEDEPNAGWISVREADRAEIGSLQAIRELPPEVRCFDADAVREALGRTEGLVTEEDLTLRMRKPGDFIRPLGSNGRKKLQDWFVDKKIPRQRRDEIPLICIGNEVLWIMGYQISENYKVREQTKRLIFVEFHQ